MVWRILTFITPGCCWPLRVITLLWLHGHGPSLRLVIRHRLQSMKTAVAIVITILVAAYRQRRCSADGMFTVAKMRRYGRRRISKENTICHDTRANIATASSCHHLRCIFIIRVACLLSPRRRYNGIGRIGIGESVTWYGRMRSLHRVIRHTAGRCRYRAGIGC